jgi:hypothetical protein
MSETAVAAGRIEAAYCIHVLCVGHPGQGLTLVHFSAQPEPI